MTKKISEINDDDKYNAFKDPVTGAVYSKPAYPPRIFVNNALATDSRYLSHAADDFADTEYLSIHEHEAILAGAKTIADDYYATIKDLEARMKTAIEALEACLHARQCNAPFGQMEKMPTANELKEALTALAEVSADKEKE